MLDAMKNQLNSLTKPAQKFTSPEPPKEIMTLDAGSFPKNEAAPTNRELDKHVVTPVSAPSCASCGNPQTKHELGWRCDTCFDRAMQRMSGVAAVANEAAPTAPIVPTEFALRLEGHRRAVLIASKAAKAACEELLRVNPEDYVASQWREHLVMIIYEVDGLYGDLGAVSDIEKPAQYVAAEHHSVNTNPQAAVTGYDAPSPVGVFGMNPQKR